MFEEIQRSYYLFSSTFKNLFLMTICLPLSLLSSIRDITVGTDTDLYYLYYVRYKFINYGDFFSSLSFVNEPLFRLYQYLFSKVFNFDFGVFLGVSTFFISYFSFKVIYKYSKIPLLSVTLYLFMGYGILHFNILRQGLAVVLFFYSIGVYLERKNFKLLLLVLVGFLLHKSFVFVGFAYLGFSLIKKLDIKALIVISIIFSVFIFFVNDLVAIVSSYDDRYQQLAEVNSENLGIMKFLLLTLMFIFCYYVQSSTKYIERFELICVYLMFLAFLLSTLTIMLGLNPNGITRASLYFEPLIIFIVPLFISKIENINERLVSIFCILSISIIYLWYFVLPYAELTPFVCREM